MLEQFQVYRKIVSTVQRAPYVPPLPHPHCLLLTSWHQYGTFIKIDEPILISYYQLNSIVYTRVDSVFRSSMSFARGTLSHIHHYGITQHSFTALKNPLLCLFILPFMLIPRNHCPFNCLHGFIFPKCHVTGIIHYLAFSDWLLSLKRNALNFLHVFSWLENSLFLLNNIPYTSKCESYAVVFSTGIRANL